MENINKLVFNPVEIDREDDDIIYEYTFEYHSNESKLNITLDFGRNYSDDDDELIKQMKINGKYTIEDVMHNGGTNISTENGFTSFHLSKYGESSGGSVNFLLKNDLCIEAIEQWLKHWKSNPSPDY